MITDFHAKYYANELTKKSSSDSFEKLACILADAQVDLNPHQIDAALFAFKSPLSTGAILADEVGLGKTIEAGIILSQKWAEAKRKLIIICPSSLRKQWMQELLDKFFLPSIIIDAESFEHYVSKKQNPFEQNKIVICSYHFAKNKEEYIKLVRWDLATCDEAQKLRSVYRNAKIAVSIKNSLESVPKLLLTATPLQNTLLELYGLVSIIDPYTFGDIQSFKSQFVRVNEEDTPNYDDLKERLSKICKRTLRKQVLEYIKYTNRIPLTQEFTPTKEEQELYDKVSAYLQKPVLYALPSAQRHLMTLILRRLLASSTFALTGTLRGLSSKLHKALEFGNLKESSDYIKRSFNDMDELSEELEDTEDDDTTLTEEDELAIKDEIKDLNEYAQISESIKINAKGEVLQKAIENGFKKLEELGAPKKALIFTEFRRTQDYLYELLSKTKYKDKIVLFNGSNTDELSNRIYIDWLKKYEGTDKISGSKTADRRAAIVDYFKDEASIMIATEAAAEGINLQFCSLVVNYDLPWNPQRIEQRIGRCHRYGQNYDVVVVNFLNNKNAADKRVFELLDQKFKLFSGVFGASDEVLGAIESGIDFEKRIIQIYNECRTTEEIQQSFDKLQTELEEQITANMTSARKKLLENFDEDVHEKLKVSLRKSQEYLNKYEKYLWDLTKYSLADKAKFNDKENSFKIEKPTFEIKPGTFKIGKKVEDAHIYRIGHPLAQEILAHSKKLSTPDSNVEFDYSKYSNKISVIEKLVGKNGELALWKINISAFEEEEYLVFVGTTSDGKILSDEQCQKMFNLNGKTKSKCVVQTDKLIHLFEQKNKEIIANLAERNSKFFDEEMTKLDKWGDDRKNSLKQSMKELDEEMKELKKQVRLSTNLPEKLKMQKKIRELDTKRDNAWKEYETNKKKIDDQADLVIDKIQARMEQKVTIEQLFAIQWKVI